MAIQFMYRQLQLGIVMTLFAVQHNRNKTDFKSTKDTTNLASDGRTMGGCGVYCEHFGGEN